MESICSWLPAWVFCYLFVLISLRVPGLEQDHVPSHKTWHEHSVLITQLLEIGNRKPSFERAHLGQLSWAEQNLNYAWKECELWRGSIIQNWRISFSRKSVYSRPTDPRTMPPLNWTERTRSFFSFFPIVFEIPFGILTSSLPGCRPPGRNLFFVHFIFDATLFRITLVVPQKKYCHFNLAPPLIFPWKSPLLSPLLTQRQLFCEPPRVSTSRQVLEPLTRFTFLIASKIFPPPPLNVLWTRR